jgi:hypothetical protein
MAVYERIAPAKWSDKITFSPAVRAGSLLFISGTTAVDENREVVGKGDIVAQTRFIFQKFDKLLKDAGASFDNIRLAFKKGRIVEATSSNTKRLNEILDSDAGARYIGEFAIGFNPHILQPMRGILFDEKIAGSVAKEAGELRVRHRSAIEAKCGQSNVLGLLARRQDRLKRSCGNRRGSCAFRLTRGAWI